MQQKGWQPSRLPARAKRAYKTKTEPRRTLHDEAWADELHPPAQEYFGSIGLIKMDKKTKAPKIWLYRNKETHALKGDGTVSYGECGCAGLQVQALGRAEV